MKAGLPLMHKNNVQTWYTKTGKDAPKKIVGDPMGHTKSFAEEKY